MLNILLSAVYYFGELLIWLILIGCILSWFPALRQNKAALLLYTLTEPIMSPIRSLLAKTPLGGPGITLDFSPVVALILIHLVRSLLMYLLAILLT